MAATIVLTTAGSRDEARRIAQSLVESRLAACVNIIPKIESVYRWENNVQNAEEWLLLIKTDSSAFESICDALKALHSYELPECVSLEITEGTKEYLAWLKDSVLVDS